MKIRIKRKYILIISGTVACILILFIVRLLIFLPLRKQIPPLPDLGAVTLLLREQLTDADKKANRNPNAENIGKLAMVYNSSAYYDEASKCYELAIKKDKTAWIWYYYLGYLNQEMGDPATAINNFRSVVRINPQVFLAWYYTGECYQKTGNSDSAIFAFQNITSKLDRNVILKNGNRYDYFPLVTYSMYNLSRIYMDKKQYDLAEKTLLEIIEYQRAFGPAYRLLGNIYSINGSDSLSKRFLVRANDLVVSPSPVDTLIDRLSLMSRSDMYLLKKIDEAEKSIFPEYALELVTHSLIYIPENNYLVAKAIKLFLIRDLGNKALPYLNQHIAYFKNDFNELKSVGDLLYKKGFYSEAMTYYSKAIALKRDDNQVQSCMVICLSKTGKKQEALNMIMNILEENKTNPLIISDEITLLFNIGEKEKAISWLSRLNRLSPDFPKGMLLAGMLADQEGKWQKALQLYSSSFEGDPEDLLTIQMLGNLLVRQQMWERAILFYRRALEYHPNDPSLLERLGTLLVTCTATELRNVREGKDLCERAFIHTTSHSVTLISAGRSLAIAYAALGDKRNANNVIMMTMNLARSENFPPDYIANLEKLKEQYNPSN